MKIGISCYPTYGGSGVVATELGIHLARRGHEVHFITYAWPSRLKDYVENIYFHEVEVPEYPLFEYPPYALALATKMADIALNERLDLIHVHYAIPHAASAYLAKCMLEGQWNLKIVTTLHGTDITLVGADPSFLRITRFGIDQSDAVTAVSRYLQQRTEETFHPRKTIQVIYNFIDDRPLQAQPCEAMRRRVAPSGEPILIHLSNFRPVKRVLDVVRIAHLVSRRLPVQLILIGDGPERPRAEALARELGFADRVTFLGKQEDVYPLLAIGDVFLMPSKQESFGLAALEAMACGVPCVTSNAGGLPEIMVDGKTGFMAPIGNLELMAQRAMEILKVPELRDKMGRWARDHAVQHFHERKVVPRYLDVYRQVMKGSL